jgi:hypothetical protein
MTTATGTATFTTWDEDPPYGEGAPLPRVASATVAFRYEGDLSGASTSRSVLSYGPDGAGTAVGFEEFRGRLGDVEGTFVLRHEDVFGPEGVTTRWEVVPGSGTGGLAGYTGSGGYQVGHGSSTWTWVLDYEAP